MEVSRFFPLPGGIVETGYLQVEGCDVAPELLYTPLHQLDLQASSPGKKGNTCLLDTRDMTKYILIQ